MKNIKRRPRKNSSKWTPDKEWIDSRPKIILNSEEGKMLSISFRNLYDLLNTTKYVYEQHINAAQNLLYKNLLVIIDSIHDCDAALSKCDWNWRTPVSIPSWGSVAMKNLIVDSDARFFELLHRLNNEDRKNMLRNLFHAKPKRTIISKEPNLLKKLDSQIRAFNKRFRDRVCRECNWSVSTYYRKIREFNYHYVYRGDDTYSNLSNADKEMIIKVMSEEYNVLQKHLLKHGI